MKAITLHQPWASLIAMGAKRFETRSWRTNYRGLVAIHSSRSYEGWEGILSDGDNGPVLEPPFSTYFPSRYDFIFGELPTGGIVAVARLIGCYPADKVAEALRAQAASVPPGSGIHRRIIHELRFGDFSPGRWALDLDVLVCGTSIGLVRGYQGLWNLTPEQDFRLRVQCAGAGVYLNDHPTARQLAA